MVISNLQLQVTHLKMMPNKHTVDAEKTYRYHQKCGAIHFRKIGHLLADLSLTQITYGNLQFSACQAWHVALPGINFREKLKGNN